MDQEKIISTLKGISSILAALSEVRVNGIIWSNWGLQLLNKELIECINALEEQFSAK